MTITITLFGLYVCTLNRTGPLNREIIHPGAISDSSADNTGCERMAGAIHR